MFNTRILLRHYPELLAHISSCKNLIKVKFLSLRCFLVLSANVGLPRARVTPKKGAQNCPEDGPVPLSLQGNRPTLLGPSTTQMDIFFFRRKKLTKVKLET